MSLAKGTEAILSSRYQFTGASTSAEHRRNRLRGDTTSIRNGELTLTWGAIS
jgi:hypothetical protein